MPSTRQIDAPEIQAVWKRAQELAIETSDAGDNQGMLLLLASYIARRARLRAETTKVSAALTRVFDQKANSMKSITIIVKGLVKDTEGLAGPVFLMGLLDDIDPTWGLKP